ncbi:SH3 domain-containing protein [Spirulina sp. CS-785/01]|uniref:SH3 domain-containing protein n=1 Tax=Spirulina sp. CS-785/01 TaxID=3021716 RepID=UPI00232E5E90|nr:SH3 domain-containing protein [Spirulina sp. CS-785/01]MDB9313272.1 SH3 domain-containing protein [Spirulina sp. CS-785/01]
MKQLHKITSTLGLTTLYSFLFTLFPQTAHSTEKPSLQPNNSYSIAQVNQCREVDVNTVLNVRQTPNGQVIGTLDNEQPVSLAGEPNNNWVQIDAPIEGYVYTEYLKECTTEIVSAPIGSEGVSTVPGSNCRKINTPNVSVRREPGGESIGRLAQDQIIYIANEGRDGWVPIERPVNAYISATYLSYCSEAEISANPPENIVPGAFGSEAISTSPGSNCRQIVDPNVTIYRKPEGEAIGQLDENQVVYIANEGRNGWVPVERPVNGFVEANNLTDCL